MNIYCFIIEYSERSQYSDNDLGNDSVPSGLVMICSFSFNKLIILIFFFFCAWGSLVVPVHCALKERTLLFLFVRFFPEPPGSSFALTCLDFKRFLPPSVPPSFPCSLQGRYSVQTLSTFTTGECRAPPNEAFLLACQRCFHELWTPDHGNGEKNVSGDWQD